MKLDAIEALLVKLRYADKDEEAYAAACTEHREANAELTKLTILERYTEALERERKVFLRENKQLKHKVKGLGIKINMMKGGGRNA